MRVWRLHIIRTWLGESQEEAKDKALKVTYIETLEKLFKKQPEQPLEDA